MKIRKHYRNNAVLRRSFNALAEATFGLNFEYWYKKGFWGDNYAPYSVIEDGNVVANVSVNRTDMVIDGQRRRLYQLGTVMTAPEYRNRGYIRAIMAEVEKDIADADGVYLFGNDNVVEFYPKFGFVPGKEYCYSRTVMQQGPCRMRQVLMDTDDNIDDLCGAMEADTFETGCRMVDNNGLIFFYAAQFMQDCVYHDELTDTWVIAEQESGELLIHNVFSYHDITLDDVIEAFGSGVTSVTLGFTPADTDGWDCREYHEEDCNFFVRGDAFRDFAEKKLRIPTLSHA